MDFLLSELTKYIAVLASAFYALDGCLCFVRGNDEKCKWSYIRQVIYIFVVQFMCYCTMCFQTKSAKYVLLFGIVQVLLISILSITPMIYEYINKLLLNNMCFLLGIGFIMMSRLSFSKAIRQILITGFAFLIALFIPIIIERWKFLRKGWLFYATLGVMLLALVFVLGEITNGSKISFAIKGVTFQPSEFVKIIFVFFLASMLRGVVSRNRVIVATIFTGAYILILVASKDLGAALIFAITYILVLFVATNSYKFLIGGVLCGAIGSIAAYFAFPHIRYRVIAWLDPFSYIEGSGYQIAQSVFAISSGGLFGTGLFNGNPKAIPYVEGDMIFSAVCEEMGMIFGILLLIICYLSFFMMIQIATHTNESFYKLICTGLSVSYMIQIFLTVGGGVKLIPLTGVTLPFVSYGGSSVMATIFVFFVIQGIYLSVIKNAMEEQEEVVDEESDT